MRINLVVFDDDDKIFWADPFVPVRDVGVFLDMLRSAANMDNVGRAIQLCAKGDAVVFTENGKLDDGKFSVEGLGEFVCEDLVFFLKNINHSRHSVGASAEDVRRKLKFGDVCIFEFVNHRLFKYR